MVSRHIRNAFQENELKHEATCAKFAQVRSEGERTVTRDVEHFNLDVVISVGYRVKSLRGTQFRQWATRTLRSHIVRGITLNRQALGERGLQEARETLDMLARTLRQQRVGECTHGVLMELIAYYAQTWDLLVGFDEGRLKTPVNTERATSALDHASALEAIAHFKQELMASGNASALFGNRRDESFAGILGSIEQTMSGEPLYPSREEKAAHLLYFIVKDRPFTDGNKRIGAFLFLLYAAQEGIDHQLNPHALTAVTLLIAERASANKDVMVRLIQHLLAENPE